MYIKISQQIKGSDILLIVMNILVSKNVAKIFFSDKNTNVVNKTENTKM